MPLRPKKKKRMKPPKKLRKKRKHIINNDITLLPDNILSQIRFDNTPIIPPRGSIRIAYLPNTYNILWKVSTLTVFARTLTQWFDLFSIYNKHELNLCEPIDPNPENPFFNGKDFSNEGLTLLLKNIRYRWLLRKFVLNIRKRIMNKRIIGIEDLCTTIRIPEEFIVRIYDWKSKSIYLFHTQTILKLILEKLKYSSYGIAVPKLPKNPYTNIPFTLGQLIIIVGQIITNLAKNHRVIPDLLLSYRKCNYDIVNFFNVNKKDLHIHAACNFFSNKDDTDVREISGEIIEDIYTEHGKLRGWTTVLKYVKERTVRHDLLVRWDALLLSFWIYQNHLIYHGWSSFSRMIDEFYVLHKETLQWHRHGYQIIYHRPVSTTQGVLFITTLDDVAQMLENIVLDN